MLSFPPGPIGLDLVLEQVPDEMGDRAQWSYMSSWCYMTSRKRTNKNRYGPMILRVVESHNLLFIAHLEVGTLVQEYGFCLQPYSAPKFFRFDQLLLPRRSAPTSIWSGPLLRFNKNTAGWKSEGLWIFFGTFAGRADLEKIKFEEEKKPSRRRHFLLSIASN